MNHLRILSVIVAGASSLWAAATSLTLNSSTKVDLNCSESNGVYTLVTTGGDPHIVTNSFSSASTDTRVEFEYQASADIDDIQLFFRNPESEARSRHYGSLKATNDWVRVSYNVSRERTSFSWGGSGSLLRLDFGNNSGITIKIRNLGINGRYTVSDSEKNAISQNVVRYLSADYYNKIENVEVTADKVIVEGYTNMDGCTLIEICPQGSAASLSGYKLVQGLPNGSFRAEFDRKYKDNNTLRDRLLSSWSIVNANSKVVAHAHYADKVQQVHYPKPGVLKNKKGIGAIGNYNMYDMDALGISSATFNVVINSFMSLRKEADDAIEHEYAGRKYYINKGQIDNYDNILKQSESKGIVVAAILLIVPEGGEAEYATTIAHPEYNKGSMNGHYCMPNLNDIDGANAYAAAIDFLAKRYSVDGQGRIHHWILHNEVDQNLEWTNMGTQPMMRYLLEYNKSMRICYNIVRQYDPNAYVLASFTSSWCSTHGNGGYSAKAMLDNLVSFSKVEGDYRWGVAAHPYPQNFFKPAFWNTDTEATYSENSGYSTFKNIEVISNWMLKPEHYYKNKEKRILFFSENGVNAMNNAASDLTVQAAGAAWAWKKTKACDGVDAIMWHNWHDNPAEGLCLGLRYENGDPKPAWYVWQAAGTANESNVLDKYLSTLGVSSWDQIFHKVSASGNVSTRIDLDLSTPEAMSISYSTDYQSYTINTTGNDPKIYSTKLSSDLNESANVLVFEYKSNKDISFQAFFSPLSYEEISVVTPLKATSEWKRIYMNISPMRKLHGWGAANSQIRFDTGETAGTEFQIRHICINSGATSSAEMLGIYNGGLNNCTMSQDAQRGESSITVTGSDPFFYTNHLVTNLNDDANKLVFEYTSTAEIPFEVYFADHVSEQRRIGTTLAASSTWKRAVIDISDIRKRHGWGFADDYLRFDPGNTSGVTFKIRSVSLNNGEFTSDHNLIVDKYHMTDLSLTYDVNPNPWEAELYYGPELAYNSFTMSTTGDDPHIIFSPLDKNLNDDATTLYFEYTSSTDISNAELFFLSPETATRRMSLGNIPAATNEWTPISVDIAAARSNFGWGYAGNRLRMDFGNVIGNTVQLRYPTIYNGDEPVSGIKTVLPTDCSIYGTIGGIFFKTNSARRFTVYNIMGIPVRNVNVDGEAFTALARGIYIVDGKKVIVR